ncbi:MAG: hypothetical protein WC679_13445 [Bacteroidales bacterium]|jgi:hypothetical protein
MTDTVSEEIKENVEQVVSPVEQNTEVKPVQQEVAESTEKEQQVPLSALQKERKKRQEYEQELKAYRDFQLKQMQMSQQPQEEDPKQYEPITKADYEKAKNADKLSIMREVEEKLWIKNNPEKIEEINERLTEFLKQRPNLAAAIEASSNRYEEAWELMDKLSPKQKIVLKQQVQEKKIAPGSPAAVSKSASMNQAIDVMNMSDDEFNAWRRSKRGAR